jgi:Fe-Mn family superoxide dismutase
MAQLTRRQLLCSVGTGAVVLATGGTIPSVVAADVPAGPRHTLPKLPYAYDALDPYIDQRTMTVHHTRHHQAYVDGINAALVGQAELQKLSLEDLLKNISKVPQTIRQRVINHGGGHYNHSLFWQLMGPKCGGPPTGQIAKAITEAFSSFAAFQKQFKQAALDRFGSGWAWLVKGRTGLEIISTPNQDCPLMSGQLPILGLDVWEHAYYLHYQNRRADYVDAWWNVVNWATVNRQLELALKE